MAKKPATESLRAQGIPKSSNPSGDSLPPPPRLGPALSAVRGEASLPLPWVGFLIKLIKTVTFRPFRTSNLPEKPGITRNIKTVNSGKTAEIVGWPSVF